MSAMRRFALVIAWVVTSVASAGAADPTRVVSLAPSVTETVFALGAGDRLVGVSVYCDYPPEVEKIDRVGTFLTPNVEAILAKKPDLVIAVPSPSNQSPVEMLQRLGLHVLVVDPNSIAEIKSSILAIGRALGREPRATELVAGIDQQIAAVEARLGEAPKRKALMVVGHTPLIAAGAHTLQDELIRLGHGTNLAAAVGNGWPRISIEHVIASNPQVIIDTTMGNEALPGEEGAMQFWKAYATIPAVREKRINGQGAYVLLRPGPRVGEAAEVMARLIHPERFQ